MRISRPVLIAGIVLISVVAYFVVRGVMGAGAAREEREAAAAAPTPAAAAAVPRVIVRAVAPTARPEIISISGRSEPARVVTVRAETPGVVTRAPVAEGGLVGEGQLLCALDAEARNARVAEARAVVRAREADFKAASDLAAKGFGAEIRVTQAQAALDGARAQLAQAQIEIGRLDVRAPFAGVFERRDAERGDYLQTGGACGQVVELNPILIVAQASEIEVERLRVGAFASARALTGETVEGRIRFIGRTSDPATRTFRVELEAHNPGLALRAGQTAQLRAVVGTADAFLLPSASLSLDSAGRIGVKIVDEDNRARFATVTIAEETPEGVWVRGFDAATRVIITGSQFVGEGQKVAPVPEPAPAARPVPVAVKTNGAG
jgi:membrane fusion protein, multidrug efflux system